MSNFGAILTNAGAAKLANAIALGVPLKLTQMAVADGNGQPVAPDPAMTAIPGEKRRAAINTLFADPLAASQLVAEQIIPEDVGGWWIRCVGLYDDSNTLIAIANVPDTYKPLLTSGAGRTQIIRMVLIVSDTSAVELKIDPAVVLATRKYVDDKLADELAKRDNKQSVRVATTGAIALSATQTIDGVALAVGDRVLVKDQADAKQNGIYLVAAQAWTRTTDADSGTDLTAGARVYVEEGTVNGTRVWYLATAGAITLGTTLLQFKDEHPAASETVRGVTRYATQAEVDEAVAGNQKDDAVVTVKKLWAWAKQASESVLGMMKVATQSQTNAGTADDVAVTPKKLRSGFAVSLAANGYIAFPTWMGGLIVQWGKTTLVNVAQASVTFPIAFPTACLSLTSNVSEGTGNYAIGQGIAPTTTGFTSAAYTAVTGAPPTANSTITIDFYWIAAGY
ncbi:phage tail protein [Aeromonas veronii]